MTDAQPFLDEIIASPDDDAPRLVYADWLLARPEPLLHARGELIIVECELARLANDPDAYNHVKRRDFALLEAYGQRWCEAVGLDGKTEFRESEWDVDFARGFMERVTVHAYYFARSAQRLFATEPVRELHVKYLAGDAIERLARMPQLARLSLLVLTESRIDDEGRARLRASPYLATCRVEIRSA